eukprot:TRINITY_DN4772_c0_g1_i1.p3 TRINITY_DN4772_c0_g1~~TRINITY_DN4772_c0_g1_i1.p3  ORF type:complete len:187 (+),score=38.48 TRINITY_DN4772_c0_g1_i1:154-714(+)
MGDLLKLLLLAEALRETDSGDTEPEYDGRWSFFDSLRSVDCNEDKTTAVCVTTHDASVFTRQWFQASGNHTFEVRLDQVNTNGPIGVGVANASAGRGDGRANFTIGEKEVSGSVGLQMRTRNGEKFCRIFHQDQAVGSGGNTEHPLLATGDVITVRVREGVLTFHRNGTQLGRGIERLTGDRKSVV